MVHKLVFKVSNTIREETVEPYEIFGPCDVTVIS